MFGRHKKDAGFTLTELLVVIGIISILAGIILVSGGPIRRDARDKSRKSDVEQISGLLQIKLSQDKDLPQPGGSRPGDYSADGQDLSENWDFSYTPSGDQPFVSFLISSGLTTQIPLDPHHPGDINFYQYAYAPSGDSLGSCQGAVYAMIARLEGSGNGGQCFTTPANYYTVISR